MSDNITIFGQTYNNVTGIKATDDNGNTVTFEKGSSAWQRPSEWPDYSKLRLREDETEAMFFTYDNRVQPTLVGLHASVNVSGGKYHADLVHIDNDGTITILNDLGDVNTGAMFRYSVPANAGDFVSIRLTPVGATHITSISMNSTTDSNNSYLSQKCVERYGYLPYCHTFGMGYGYRDWNCHRVVSETLLGTASEVQRYAGFQSESSLENFPMDYLPNKIPVPAANFFSGTASLKNFDFSRLSITGASPFSQCSQLGVSELDLSSVTLDITSNIVINQSPHLRKVKLPHGAYGTVNFASCSALQVVDIPADATTTSISSNAFQTSIYSLRAVVLRPNRVIATANANDNTFGIGNNNIENGALKFYVPASQLQAYKEATNWTTKYSTYGDTMFETIEGSEFEETV